jgi:hypothetical protein
MIVALWGVFGLLLVTGLNGNWNRSWSFTGINAQDTPFGDIRTIPDAVTLSSQGIDPYTPTVRSLNYPRIWVRLFAFTGLSEHLVAFELCMISLYLLCLSHLLLTVHSRWSALLVLVGGLSSVSFLAVERGNNDLLAFSITYLATIPAAPELAAALLLIGALLKFYPAAGLVARAMTESRYQFKVYAAALIAVGIYVLTQWPDLVKIEQNTPHSFRQSYGVNSLAAGLDAHWRGPSRLVLTALAVLLLVAAVLIGRRHSARSHTAPRLFSGASPRFYAVFVLVFLSTFLLTPNYEYRLIYLIPLFPFYIDLIAEPACRKWAYAAILLALLSIDNRILHDSAVLKAAAYTSRILLFAVNGVILGLTWDTWSFARLIDVRRRSRDYTGEQTEVSSRL